VERIPFAETRGYVKNVLLNREIYAWLYPSLDTGT
jgi:soluble lytic murein transglycosylase-like protein